MDNSGLDLIEGNVILKRDGTKSKKEEKESALVAIGGNIFSCAFGAHPLSFAGTAE